MMYVEVRAGAVTGVGSGSFAVIWGCEVKQPTCRTITASFCL